MMAAPSSGTPLVMTTASPTLAPPVVTRRSFSTSPSIVPAMIGRSRPCVISVWPPTSVTSSSSHAAWSSAKRASTDASVVAPAGRSSVARNHRARAPRTAMSFAFTWSAYQPISGGRERDRVAGRDEISVAHVDDRGIFTDPGPDDDAGILELVLVEDRLQRVGTKLADWQGPHADDQYTRRRLGAAQIRSLSRSEVRS